MSAKGVWAQDLAQTTGYDAASLDLWLRVAYRHRLLVFDPKHGYRLAPELEAVPEQFFSWGEGWGAYHPPYDLSCDLALFLRLVPAEAATRWAGMPVWALQGRAPLLVLAARYSRAEVGPEGRPVLPPQGSPFLYQEVGCALPVTGAGPSAYIFPALWVESRDPLLLDLGWRYGFPKYAAKVELCHSPWRIGLKAADAEGVLLEAEAWKLAPLPRRAVVALARLRAIFPVWGQEAVLHLQSLERAWLLLPRRVRLPRLEALGLTGPSLGGFWLEGARLYLSEPSPLP